MKNKIFQSRDLCLRTLDTNSACAKSVRRNEEENQTIICAGFVLSLLQRKGRDGFNEFDVQRTMGKIPKKNICLSHKFCHLVGFLGRHEVVKDGYAPDHYDEVSYSVEQINERALGTVTNSLMEVVTGRYFEPVDGEEEIIREYFDGKDWNALELSEQLVILGDTAYWCIF